jgi:hypothetical protein
MIPEKRKAAPAGAAKFREETPRKGRGDAKRKFAMPRCNNMALLQCGSKPNRQPNVNFFRHKYWVYWIIYYVYFLITLRRSFVHRKMSPVSHI